MNIKKSFTPTKKDWEELKNIIIYTAIGVPVVVSVLVIGGLALNSIQTSDKKPHNPSNTDAIPTINTNHEELPIGHTIPSTNYKHQDIYPTQPNKIPKLPLFGYGEVPMSVKRVLKQHLREPTSFEVVECLSMIEVGGSYRMTFIFASRNGFGGMVKHICEATVYQTSSNPGWWQCDSVSIH